MIDRRTFMVHTAAGFGVGLAPLPVLAASDEDLERSLWRLLSRNPQQHYTGLKEIEGRGGIELASSVILASRFGSGSGTDDLLRKLTGAERQGWFDWMLWQEEHPEVASHPVYYKFKRDLFLQIDRNFEVFLDLDDIQPDAMKIRFEEVTWGGVRKDGIPSLDNPDLIDAGQAEYLLDDDLVFGVNINGDARAYPLRIMGWHEMFNEVIGDVPVALAYCTLCGAGILFETQVEGRAAPLVFGSSGFLYRSNKLMFDRETHSLWNQFTGRPVSGDLVDNGIELKQRPVVITEWARWRADHPNTRVLSLNTGHDRDYGSGVVYKSYFATDDLMFPAILGRDELRQKDFVFGIRAPGGAKAWPLSAFEGGRVINDRVGFQNVVLIGDAETRTVRAYDRGDLVLGSDLTTADQTWRVTEDAVIGTDGTQLPRIAGHVAYWFAWAGYLGRDTELFKDG